LAITPTLIRNKSKKYFLWKLYLKVVVLITGNLNFLILGNIPKALRFRDVQKTFLKICVTHFKYLF